MIIYLWCAYELLDANIWCEFSLIHHWNPRIDSWVPHKCRLFETPLGLEPEQYPETKNNYYYSIIL